MPQITVDRHNLDLDQLILQPVSHTMSAEIQLVDLHSRDLGLVRVLVEDRE
jgi:hypothetical protein